MNSDGDGGQPTDLRPGLARAGPRRPGRAAVPPSTAALPGADGPRRRRAAPRRLPARLPRGTRGHRTLHLAARDLRAVPQRAVLPRGAERAGLPGPGVPPDAGRRAAPERRALLRGRPRRGALPGRLSHRDDLRGHHVLESCLPAGDGEALKGERLIDLLAEDDRAAFRTALGAGFENRSFEIEGRLRGADGALIAYQWTGAPLTDEHGHVSGVTGVGRDVTDRKRAEEILRQRESEMRQLQKIEAIGRLAGGVAHDFNNVLTVVIGRCQLMLSRYQPDDPAYQDLDQIEATAQRAAGLTRQLLAFSRNQGSARQPLDLNATVTSVSDMLARLIGENIALAVELDPKLELVKADHGKIEQVIVNFAVNARDAMPGGGRLTIATRNVMLNAAFVSAHPAASAGPHVLLEARDTGAGMDEATLQRAFEPSFTTKAPGKGCGLGLSTVYGMVKQHEGYTAVESEPGHGAPFRVYLPRIEVPVEAPRGADGRGPLPGGQEA